MGTAFDHTSLAQRVIFQSHQAVANAVAQVRERGSSRLLLITDVSAQAIGDAIAAKVNVAVRITEVIQHVPAESASEVTRSATEEDCDLILSVGGGSATGLAKVVALRSGLDIIAVPTTFAGSEATDVWGITDRDRKTTGRDPRVAPKVIIYDPALSATLPAQLAVASGLNALAHAVDGLWAPNANPINRALGTEGVRALVPGLRAVHANPDDLGARENVVYGTYLASVAFAGAGSGLHHKICHVLGGRFGLSHSEMHAVVLGHVAEFNMPAAPEAARRLESVFRGDPVDGLFSLAEEIDAPTSLAILGLREEDLDEAAELIMPAIPVSNPRDVTVSDISGILRAAWSGRRMKRGGEQ